MKNTSVIEYKVGNNGKVERRRFPRFKAQSACAIKQGSWFHRKKINGTIVDWSQTGVRFRADRPGPGLNGGPVHFPVRYPHSHTARNVTAVVVRCGSTPDGRPLYGLRFSRDLAAKKSETRVAVHSFLVKSFIVAVVITLMAIKIEHIQWFWYGPIFRFYTLMAGFFIGTRFLFSIFYKEPPDAGYFPSVSVIIAVKNEEDHIAETVKRAFESRYPMDRFEVMVVDDGSTDGTWTVLQNLQTTFPRLTLIKFEKNKGKRHAMAVGAQKAKGDILVYVDSDSFIEPDGIYKLVQVFDDPTVGAAAGHTRVRVVATNPISKMEAVRYFVSHQLFKASEGLFRAVTCCPGAFSAYRRNAVLRVLPDWLNQTFLGTPATFGDDRSLTNFILRDYDVMYHAGAVCFTYVPTTWSQFFRQQLRWKKSWAREAIIAAPILLKKHPLAALSFFMGIAITLFSPIVFFRAVIYGPLILGFMATPYLLGLLFIYLALCVYYLLHVPRFHWIYGLLFAGLYMIFLCWQTYYAILTVNHNHWGTR